MRAQTASARAPTRPCFLAARRPPYLIRHVERLGDNKRVLARPAKPLQQLSEQPHVSGQRVLTVGSHLRLKLLLSGAVVLVVSQPANDALAQSLLLLVPVGKLGVPKLVWVESGKGECANVKKSCLPQATKESRARCSAHLCLDRGKDDVARFQLKLPLPYQNCLVKPKKGCTGRVSLVRSIDLRWPRGRRSRGWAFMTATVAQQSPTKSTCASAQQRSVT